MLTHLVQYLKHLDCNSLSGARCCTNCGKRNRLAAQVNRTLRRTSQKALAHDPRLAAVRHGA